ncbi:MAG: hypothetical protein GY745_05635 [Actinomycetia bacterium]|nr:hypothetical protein [Actinomycetes bacterium]MCP3910481.1 hypothetical protein [Actinomycetes bacterium]MCP4084515.1 hypothetical protein [Actinomycetes bacterium]
MEDTEATDDLRHREEPACYMTETRRLYDGLGYPPYRWVEIPEPPALVHLDKPLSECKVGLIGSGGVYEVGQVAFHHMDDSSYRVIPGDVDLADLRTSHFAYDLTDARSDPNVVFPIDRLRELEADEVVGELGDEFWAFMGGIYSARKVRDELAPALVARAVEHELDVVLLVPV